MRTLCESWAPRTSSASAWVGGSGGATRSPLPRWWSRRRRRPETFVGLTGLAQASDQPCPDGSDFGLTSEAIDVDAIQALDSLDLRAPPELRIPAIPRHLAQDLNR